MCDHDDQQDHKSLAEQELESRQRAYELGKRYGILDARAGRPDDPNKAAQMDLSGPLADLYCEGWHETYDPYVARLNEQGHHLSVPSLVTGERILATTTGRTRTDSGGLLHVEMLTPDGDAPLWLAVHLVRVIR